MKILDRYIARQLLGVTALGVMALIFADLSRKNDTMLPYILLWLPNIITVAVALHLHKRARHKG